MFKIMFINFNVFFEGLGIGKPKFLPGKNLKLRFPVIFSQAAARVQADIRKTWCAMACARRPGRPSGKLRS